MAARTLDVSALVDTAQRLQARVRERFAGRGIEAVAGELVAVAEEARTEVAELQRPQWRLRAVIATGFAIALLAVVLSLTRVRLDADVQGLDGWLALVETAIQDLVFLGIAALFVLRIEPRRKRRRALAALHELRSLVHVIDMHQLTKDPDFLISPLGATPSSPPRTMTAAELTRYLDYCSEMVSITSKVGALYAQHSDDAVVLEVVREIQDLSTGLSSKIWQKIMILDTTSLRT